MAPYTFDPRLRQSLDQLSERIEDLNQRVQTALYHISQSCVQPCCFSLQACFEATCQPCFTARDATRRSRQTRLAQQRGRDVAFFEFYNDWAADDNGDGTGDHYANADTDGIESEDEDEAYQDGHDESSALLGRRARTHAGSRTSQQTQQPSRHGGMIYGYGSINRIFGRSSKDGKAKMQNSSQRRSHILAPGEDTDEANATVIPQSSIFGFLESLPWKIGGRGGARYQTPAANLQHGLGKGDRKTVSSSSRQSHIQRQQYDESKSPSQRDQRNQRARSMTAQSNETGRTQDTRESSHTKTSQISRTTHSGSLSSRDDLLPSDEEGDAREIGDVDDFALMMLARQSTSGTALSEDDHSTSRHSLPDSPP